MGCGCGIWRQRQEYLLCVGTPEYVKGLEKWKETEQEWEAFLETLSEGQREKAEVMKECREDFASVQENRAYIQGYADCIQVLYHMGLLKENEGLKWAEKMELQKFLSLSKIILFSTQRTADFFEYISERPLHIRKGGHDERQ